METLALPVWLAFISSWMRNSKKSALLLSLINFPFQLWVFFLFCLPSALLEWFLNICTETKTSGIVCRCHPCKEKLDTVMNVGRITSLYFNFEGTLWCSLCHRTVFVQTMQHFSWSLVFSALPSIRPLLSPDHFGTWAQLGLDALDYYGFVFLLPIKCAP